MRLSDKCGKCDWCGKRQKILFEGFCDQQCAQNYMDAEEEYEAQILEKELYEQ